MKHGFIKVAAAAPEIRVADPMFNADAVIRAMDEHARLGVKVLMVSHDVEFCARYAHRCALFFDGSISAEGTPRTFFGGNSFYTTAANRMSRHLFQNALTAEDVAQLCRRNAR